STRASFFGVGIGLHPLPIPTNEPTRLALALETTTPRAAEARGASAGTASAPWLPPPCLGRSRLSAPRTGAPAVYGGRLESSIVAPGADGGSIAPGPASGCRPPHRARPPRPAARPGSSSSSR